MYELNNEGIAINLVQSKMLDFQQNTSIQDGLFLIESEWEG